MLSKMLHPVLALALAAGVATAPVEPAHAGGRGVAAGIAAGILGLAIIGAASRDRAYAYDDYGPGCYRGPRRCYWTGRRCFENEYGDTICRGGDYVCRRPLICD